MTETTIAPGQPSVPPTASKSPSSSSRWAEIVHVVLLTLAIVIPVRVFLANPFKVQGASMEPNYFDKEYLIIDELSYRLHAPIRGEVIVFRPPTDPTKFFIKRVIGLPGDTVELMNGVVKIYNAEHPNGWVLDESSYLDLTDLSEEERASMSMRPLTLGEDEYFVMGDNRRASYDSRFFGAIQEESIVGRAFVRGWPVHRWGMLTDLPPYPEAGT
jgi:signal peptidase I